MSFKDTNNKQPGRARQGGDKGSNVPVGVYVATVSKIADSLYTGRITVYIKEFSSDTDHGEKTVRLMTPYGGTTDPLLVSDDVKAYGFQGQSDYGTVKTYGMWPQPPVPGTEVVVAFTAGQPDGILMGSLISRERNFMMAGNASCQAYLNGGIKIAPAGEKNPYDTNDDITRPADPVAYRKLEEQGLHEDYTRGHSASSARRESPSKVFGITTRYGHTFTMDDGDLEGQSKSIRIRSREGAQILIDDTNKFIFVTNHDGTSWVEIDEDGNIDVYAKGKISMHTEEDFNIHAKGNINMQADKNINMKAMGPTGIRVETTVGDIDITSGAHMKLTAAQTTNILSSHHIETANRIDMNGPQAARAIKPEINSLPPNKNITTSVANRVPEHHPWEGVTKKQPTLSESKGNIA